MQYHQTAVVPRESILKTEAEWLGSVKADLVVLLPCCAII
jgi:L-arabinokinase